MATKAKTRRKRTTMRALCQGKPSVALKAMCDGLREHSKRDDFAVRMGTYGDAEGNICYGCAATCAVQQIAGVRFTPNTVPVDHWHDGFENHAKACGILHADIREFEFAIDNAREGEMERLFSYFNVPVESRLGNGTWCMGTDNWPGEIRKVRHYIAKLQKLGL